MVIEWTFIKKVWTTIPESEKTVVWILAKSETAPQIIYKDRIVEVIKEVPVEVIKEVPCKELSEKQLDLKTREKFKAYEDSLEDYKQKLFDIRQEISVTITDRNKWKSNYEELEKNFDAKVQIYKDENETNKKLISDLQESKRNSKKYVTKLLATIQRHENNSWKTADQKQVKTIIEQLESELEELL